MTYFTILRVAEIDDINLMTECFVKFLLFDRMLQRSLTYNNFIEWISNHIWVAFDEYICVEIEHAKKLHVCVF